MDNAGFDIGGLNYVKRRDPITARGHNAIIRSVTSLIQQQEEETQRRFCIIHNNTAGDMEPFSAFGFSDGAIDYGRVKLTAAYGSTPVVVTNSHWPIAADAYGWGHFADRWAPTRFVAGGAISPGDVCGPSDSSFRITATGVGLIALTPAVADGDEIWCIDQGGSAGLVAAKVTTQITARSGLTVGAGVGTVYKVVGSTLTSVETGTAIKSVYSKVILADVWITLNRDSEGVYWVVGADCP